MLTLRTRSERKSLYAAVITSQINISLDEFTDFTSKQLLYKSVDFVQFNCTKTDVASERLLNTGVKRGDPLTRFLSLSCKSL